MEKNMNSWECDKLFASEASGPQKNLKMGLGGNLKFCGYGFQIQLSASKFNYFFLTSLDHLLVSMVLLFPEIPWFSS